MDKRVKVKTKTKNLLWIWLVEVSDLGLYQARLNTKEPQPGVLKKEKEKRYHPVPYTEAVI